MIYAIYSALVVVAFLTILNGFLRGAKKAQLDAVFSLLLLGLVIASFVVAGWKLGLLSIGVAFIGALLTRPLAARVASRLLSASTGDSSGAYIGLPPKPLERISQELGRQIDPSKLVDEMLSGSGRRDQAEQALLDYCEGQPAIQELMTQHEVTRNDLKELYGRLLAVGAGQWACGHWVAASAIAYPDALRYLLNHQDSDWRTTAYNLIMHFERGQLLEQSG